MTLFLPTLRAGAVWTIVFCLAIAGLGRTQKLTAADNHKIEPRLVHLRSGGSQPEWSTFASTPEGTYLERRFSADANPTEFSLRIRQQDVKQAWRVLLNDKPLGELINEEVDLVHFLAVPAGSLRSGENVLRVEPAARSGKAPDDIRVGDCSIEPRSVQDALGEATVEIAVVDSVSSQPLPARITITDSQGSRHPVAIEASDRLAVRTGVIYSADDKARFGLPAGDYTIYAGRGFEYSLAKEKVSLAKGATLRRRLELRREVLTPGYVACDTHIHTLSSSGHGDATIAERMITLAGEGIELPIATDHNVHVDYEEHAQRADVRKHFTPVRGNEVTTSQGHFNIFPVAPGARVPNWRQKVWSKNFDEIFATPGVKVAILNHARDLHSGTRPFGTQWFNEAVGQNIAGWPMRFQGMEVINSGATQTDPLRLFRDWMVVLNAGHQVTPVGSSDSHDVARYIVGQGRTYIRCDDRDVANLDVDAAVVNFLQGRVRVSYGLLTELTVNDKYTDGEFAAVAGNEVAVAIRVLGPHWTSAERLQLYANGELVREESLSQPREGRLPVGVQADVTWKLRRPKHDVHLVAIALGKGIDGPYWATAKPYQPTSPVWQSYTIGASGAVWVDGDGDGCRTSARGYAERLLAEAGGDAPKWVAELAHYDGPTAAQAAFLYQKSGGSLADESLEQALKTAPKHVIAGVAVYRAAWRANELAKGQPE